MSYVIYKKSRYPGKKSYSGPTWDKAGIRHLCEDYYKSKEEARLLAVILSRFNPVGFDVSESKDGMI